MNNKLKLLEDMINGVSVSTFIYRNYKDVDNLIESFNIILNIMKEDEIDNEFIKSFYTKAINDIQLVINKTEEQLIPELLLSREYNDISKLSKILDKLYTLQLVLNDNLVKNYKYRNEKFLVLCEYAELDTIISKVLKDVKIVDNYKIKGIYTYIGHEYNVIGSTSIDNISNELVFKKILTTSDFYEKNTHKFKKLTFQDLEII